METQRPKDDDPIEVTRRWVHEYVRAIVDHPEGVTLQTIQSGQLVVFVLYTYETDRISLEQHRDHPIQCLDMLVRLWGIRKARRYQVLVEGSAQTISIGDHEPSTPSMPRRVVEKGFERGNFRVLHGD